MKTIEEKAKAYDRALEIAKAWHKLDNNDLSNDDLETLFPELKESEGEKIRKWLIEYFGKINNEIDIQDRGEIISWLEKQGTPTDINPSEFDLRLNKLLKQFETLPKEELVNCLSFYLNTVQNDGIYQRADNPADKVKPKFKVGDWVVQGHNIMKIKCVGDTHYCFETVSGYVDDMLVSEIDSQFHLWAIQDAKDGDVLFMDNGSANCIFIYKSSNNGIINKYASYNNFGFEGEHYLVLNDGYVIPATKEQRDLLSQKMKEAGYEWDAEKKELKKIEQKPAEWSEKDEKTWKELIEEVKDQLDSVPAPDCRDKEDEKALKQLTKWLVWLKSIKDRYTWKPSDEQMKQLGWIVEQNKDNMIGKELISLYQDLRKLREG